MKYIVDVNGERHEVTVEGETVSVAGESAAARLISIDGTPVRLLRIGDVVHRVAVRRGQRPGAYVLSIDGFRYAVDALDERSRAIQDRAAATSASRGPSPLVAPMPGLIVRVTVSVGDSVEAGAGLVVMEAMKMENELRTPAAGRVRAVHAAPGKAVEKGAVLVELDAPASG